MNIRIPFSFWWQGKKWACQTVQFSACSHATTKLTSPMVYNNKTLLYATKQPTNSKKKKAFTDFWLNFQRAYNLKITFCDVTDGTETSQWLLRVSAGDSESIQTHLHVVILQPFAKNQLISFFPLVQSHTTTSHRYCQKSTGRISLLIYNKTNSESRSHKYSDPLLSVE